MKKCILKSIIVLVLMSSLFTVVSCTADDLNDESQTTVNAKDGEEPEVDPTKVIPPTNG